MSDEFGGYEGDMFGFPVEPISRLFSRLSASTETGSLDPDPRDKIKDILESIRMETTRAIVKHPKPIVSLHEGHSIIREEFDEFWDEVKRQKPDPHKTREELIQTAAMCVRVIFEVLDSPAPKITRG